jgi:3-oxoacyl-[acyl-carrier protein] reductase
MTKSLAKELGPSNIRVNSIAPGFIDTDMNKNLSADTISNIKEDIPLNRIGTTNSISKCINWLIEDDFTTGQIISINGGWVIT